MNYDILFAICAMVYTIGVLACGIVLGATIVADWLHRREMRPAKPVAKKPEPITTIVPYMVALDGGAAKWRRLEIPTVKRRRTEKN